MRTVAKCLRTATVVVVIGLVATFAAAQPANAAVPINRKPASPQTLRFRADKPLTGFGVSDLDGTALAVELTINGAGTRPRFSLGSTAGLTIATGSATNSLAVGLTGSQANLNAALATLVVHPSTVIAAGTWTMQIATSDLSTTDTDTITLNQLADVAPVNTKPASQSLVLGVDKPIAGLSVADDDGSPLEVELNLTGAGTKPTFSLPSTTGLVVTGSAAHSTAVTISGSQTNLNAALAGLIVHPSTDPAVASYTFVIESDDVTGSDPAPNELADTDFFVLNQAADVTPVNTKPGSPQQLLTDITSPLPGFSVFDADGSPLEVELDVGGVAPKPTFTFGSVAGLAVTTGSITDSTSVTLTGSQDALNAAFATLSVTGTAAPGSRNLVIETDDTVGSSGGFADTDFIVLNVVQNVAPVNTKPDSPQDLRFGVDKKVPGFAVSDANNTPLEVELSFNGAGTMPQFSLLSTTGVSGLAAGTKVTSATISGTQAALNDALATLVVHPSPDLTNQAWNLVMKTDDTVGTTGGLSDTDQILVIQAADVAPVNTLPASPQTLGTNTPRSLNGISVADTDGSKLEVRLSVTGGGTKPTFTFGSTTGLTVSAGATSNSTSATISGSQAALNTALGTLSMKGSLAAGSFNLVVDTDDTVGTTGGLFDTDILALDVAAVPSAPLDVTAIGGDGNAAVAWKAPTSSGGLPILGYEVKVSPGGTTFDAGTSLSAVFPGLSNGDQRTFTVRARNANGFGPWSAPSNEALPRLSCTVAPFSDVAVSHPFCPEIDWLSAHEIAGGFPDGTFRPTVSVTRQALAAFSYRLAGSPNGDDPSCSSAPFTDIPVSHGFCGEIAWAQSEGIVSGFPDGTYRPGNVVSRQAMAAVLYRLAGSPRGEDPACTTDAFTDVTTAHAFCGEIDWLVDSGIATGFSDGTFQPSSPVTRQAMAAFIFRYNVLTDVIPH